MKFLAESGLAAKIKFQEIDRELDQKLFENAEEQEELRKKLADLQQRETKLEEEKETRQSIQEIAEEVIINRLNYNNNHNHYNLLKCDWCINCCILH